MVTKKVAGSFLLICVALLESKMNLPIKEMYSEPKFYKGAVDRMDSLNKSEFEPIAEH